MKRVNTSHRIAEQFHTFDSQNHFVGVKINIISKSEFIVENEAQISPSFFKEKGRTANGR